MKKSMIVLSIGLLLLLMLVGCGRYKPVDGQIKELNGVIEELNGVIEKKGWAKSAESYCAQGSDYFVLTIQDEKIILNYSNKFEDYINKTVSVKGRFLKREIPCPPNHQCLMTADGGPYVCEVFEVVEIQ